MLVSIIIPIYNVAEFLPRCINSVINQSYKNIEIILVNDGSTDNSADIIDQYDDARIKVVTKKNGGLSSARNAGLEIATGDYVTFVDSDDWIDESMVKIMVNAAINENSDIVVIKELATSVKVDTNAFRTINSPSVYTGAECMSMLCRMKIPTYSWGKLYKMKLWKHLRFPEGRNYEDVATSYIVFSQCERLSVIDSVLYFYFVREDSIVHTKRLRNAVNMLSSLKEMHEFDCSNPYWGYYRCKILYGSLVYALRLPLSERLLPEYSNVIKSLENIREDIQLGRPLLSFLFQHDFYKVFLLKTNLYKIAMLKR